MNTTTLSILILVAIIYLLIMIGAVVLIRKKKISLKQTIDPKPEQQFNVKDEKQNQ